MLNCFKESAESCGFREIVFEMHRKRLELFTLCFLPDQLLSSPRARRDQATWRLQYRLSFSACYLYPVILTCRSQWSRGLRRRSLAARLLRLWVRIPPGAWIFVCSDCCVLSGRGLCDGLIIRSEESYWMWRVVVCDQETSQARRLKPTRGL